MEGLNGHATRPRLAELPPYQCPEHPSEQSAKQNSKVRNPKALGRFQAMNAFADHYTRLVDTTAQVVWFILFRDVKSNGLATVSLQQIADRIGVHRRTVMRAVKQLKDAGLLTVVARGTTNHGPSIYRVHGRPRETATGDTHVT
jgi:DNA-binding transcriptional ArsR family regulator